MPLFAIPFPFSDPNAPFVVPPFEIGPLTIALAVKESDGELLIEVQAVAAL